MHRGDEKYIQNFGWKDCREETTRKTYAYERIILKLNFGK
jgi:hypothetical protein